MEDLFILKLKQIITENRIRFNEPMEYHTSLHIGGEADSFVMPLDSDEIKKLVLLCREQGMPYYIMGNGSNLLVSDEGYRGLIIRLGEQFSDIKISVDGTVRAKAGVLLSRLANEIAKHELTGFEFASGIPGTLGGAVTMNAGAYGGEIKQCLISATVMDEEGRIQELGNEELKLDYRSSILQNKNYCVLEAVLKFEKGNKPDILGKMQELNGLRREKQPLDQYSAGSTFRRPAGYFAGKLIHDAGLGGFQIGGAAVSEKHCGFLINKDNATAGDFMALIRHVIRTVEEKFGVRMEPEVKFLGTFN